MILFDQNISTRLLLTEMPSREIAYSFGTTVTVARLLSE